MSIRFYFNNFEDQTANLPGQKANLTLEELPTLRNGEVGQVLKYVLQYLTQCNLAKEYDQLKACFALADVE